MGPQKIKKKFQIIPAILETRWENLEKQTWRIECFSKFLHIDVSDGKFVPHKTFLNLKKLSELNPKFFLEVHLMVEDPESYLKTLLSNSRIHEIIIHIESFSSPLKLLKCLSKVRKSKKRIGIALNPKTPVKQILPWIEQIDELYFLTVEPGKQGNSFQSMVLKKIKNLSGRTKNVILAADGGVSDTTILQCHRVGATKFVVGSFIVGSDNPKKQFLKLCTLLRHTHVAKKSHHKTT